MWPFWLWLAILLQGEFWCVQSNGVAIKSVYQFCRCWAPQWCALWFWHNLTMLSSWKGDLPVVDWIWRLQMTHKALVTSKLYLHHQKELLTCTLDYLDMWRSLILWNNVKYKVDMKKIKYFRISIVTHKTRHISPCFMLILSLHYQKNMAFMTWNIFLTSLHTSHQSTTICSICFCSPPPLSPSSLVTVRLSHPSRTTPTMLRMCQCHLGVRVEDKMVNEEKKEMKRHREIVQVVLKGWQLNINYCFHMCRDNFGRTMRWMDHKATPDISHVTRCWGVI